MRVNTDPTLEGKPLLWRANKGLMWFLLLPGLGMGIAGFLVAPGSKTDDGLPLNIFLWAMGGFWIVTNVLILTITAGVNRRRVDLLQNGYPGTARVLSIERTGTTINDNPVMAIRLEVNDGFHGLYETTHKEAIPVEELYQLRVGSVVDIRAHQTKTGKLLLLLK
jgi:hypothetical protein